MALAIGAAPQPISASRNLRCIIADVKETERKLAQKTSHNSLATAQDCEACQIIRQLERQYRHRQSLS
jgi:hypothetical protein